MVRPLQHLVSAAAIALMRNVAEGELYSADETHKVLQDFSCGFPCSQSVRVSSIINASYQLRDGHATWHPELNLPQEERQWLLSDLVFKSLELRQFRSQSAPELNQ